MNADIMHLVGNILETHPLQGNSRVCNKLLGFLSACTSHERITQKTLQVYTGLMVGVDLRFITNQIDYITTNLPKVVLNQLSVSGKPKWYRASQQHVDKTLLLQLLFTNEDWTKIDTRFGTSKPTTRE